MAVNVPQVVFVPTPVGSAPLFANVTFNGAIHDLKVSGDLAYIVGSFTSITDDDGTYACNGVACLDLSTQLFTSFRPLLTGGLDPTGRAVDVDATYCYIGGTFTTVDGTTRNNIARVNHSTDVLDATWNPNADNAVYSIHVGASVIWAGGTFNNIGAAARDGLAALTTVTTGAATAWVLSNAGAAFFAGSGISSCRRIQEVGTILHFVGQLTFASAVATFMADNYGQALVSNGFLTAMARAPSSPFLTGLAATVTGAYYAGDQLSEVTTLPDKGEPTDVIYGAQFMTSAALGAFDPDILGIADTILEDVSGDLFIGGSFVSVGVTSQEYLARVTTTGAIVAGFAPVLGGTNRMRALGRYSDWLIAGGDFVGTVNGDTHNYFTVVHKDTGALI